jgi:hypothetical protein
MMKFLGLRFWVLSFLFMGVLISFHPAIKLHSKIAHNLTFTPESDVVSISQSAIQRIMPDTGLSVVTEKRLMSFLQQVARVEVEKMSETQNEWLTYAKGWFERVYPNETRFNQYVEAWVTHRELKTRVRASLRERYFPDFSDKELIQKASWLQSQEEWSEMNQKIDSEISTLEIEYNLKLEAILGTKREQFSKLHELFVKDFFSDSGAPENFFL